MPVGVAVGLTRVDVAETFTGVAVGVSLAVQAVREMKTRMSARDNPSRNVVFRGRAIRIFMKQ
jgi:hypothetical protein